MPGGNPPTLARCPYCRQYFPVAELVTHKPACLDNPDNK